MKFISAMNSPPVPTLHRARGSAFLTVIIFTFALTLIAAAILGWSLAERRINMRTAYWLEARTAAEALAEYGFAQVQNNFINTAPSLQVTFDPALGKTASNVPIAPPPATFFNPNGSTVASNGTTPSCHVDTRALSSTVPTGYEVVAGYYNPGTTGGVIGTPGYDVFSSNDPSNAYDPWKNVALNRVDIMVVAKATVIPPDGSEPVSAYVSQTMAERGSSANKDAFLYTQNDMEIFPGPQMDIYGPVHVNGNLFASSQGGTLNFHGAVSATGNLYHAWADTNGTGEGSGSEGLGSAAVNFAVDSTGTTLVSLYDSANSRWDDSTWGTDASLFNTAGLYSNSATSALSQLSGQTTSATTTSFDSYAQTTWNGNVKIGSGMGALVENPAGFGLPIAGSSGATYTPDQTGVETLNTDGSNISDINDPPDTHLSPSDTYYQGKEALERAKFSNQAGLYVDVQVAAGTSGSPDSATITLYGPGDSTKVGQTGYGPNGGSPLGTVPTGLVSFVPYTATQNGTLTTPGSVTTPTAGSVSATVASASGTAGAVTSPSITVTGSGTKWKYSYPAFHTAYTYTYSYNYNYGINKTTQPRVTTQPVVATVDGAGNIISSSNSGSSSTTNTGTTTSTTDSFTGSGSGSGSGSYTDSAHSLSTSFSTQALALAAGNSALASQIAADNSAVVAAANSAATSSASSTANSAANSAQSVELATYSATSSTGSPATTLTSSGGTVLQGLYDQRQKTGINLVQIDMQALNTALTDINSRGGSAPTTSNSSKDITDSSGNVLASSKWTGVIYVDVEDPTGGQTSVGLANGKVTSGQSLVPTISNGSPATPPPGGGSTVTGLTIATNAPTYIEGNFNADGTLTTSGSAISANTPDDGKTDSTSSNMSAETPVAIVADAVTILSPDYFGVTGSGTAAVPYFPSNSAMLNPTSSSNAYKSLSTAKPSDTGNTEIAASMITGFVATTDGASSGGAHNLPRFLENWGSTVAIRGSLMSFYLSKVATGPWSTKYYGAPTRSWGYDQILNYVTLQGTHPFPSIRRVSFLDLSAASYTAARLQMYPTETFNTVTY